MQDAQFILERLAELTRLHSLNELETNLLRAMEEFFLPRDVFLLTIDSRGDARMLRRGPAASAVPGCSGDVDEPIVRLGAEALHEAHMERALSHRSCGDAGCLVAYPLISSPPLRTGIVMVVAPGQAERDEAAERTVLDIFRNFGELLDSAQRDELTRLLNRKTFDDNIHRVIARAVAMEQTPDADDRRAGPDPLPPAAGATSGQHHVAIVDIDHFKAVNDEFGHLLGDEVLVSLAHRLRENFRDTDLIYRFGGEEFVIVLISVDRDGAAAALERLRQELSDGEFPRVGRVTISYGLAQVEPSILVHQLLDRADSALYFAKENGRNQGHYYDDLLRAGRIEPVADPVGAVELF